MMFHSKKAAGFSLIELMVVMAIMAIVMGLTGGLVTKAVDQQTRQVELQKVRQKVQDLTRYVENRQKSLLDHIKEGVEKEFFFI